MSSLLEQAVIDAQSLREAALRNAETAILEKYSDEIKGAIDVMLEAEIGLPEDEFVSPEEEVAVPALAAAEGEDLCGCPEAGEEVEWELSLDDLKAMSDEMETGTPMGQEELAPELGAPTEEEDFMLEEEIDLVLEDEELEEGIMDFIPGTAAYNIASDIGNLKREEAEALKAKLEAYIASMPPAEGETGERIETTRLPGVKMAGITAESIDEDIELDEEMVREIVEELVVDISPQKSGWAGTPEPIVRHQEEQALARLAGTEARGHNDALVVANQELSETKKVVGAENKKLKELIYALKGKLDESILSNAKLLYTNQTLTSASLNERQKNRIVESIQNADSVEEAKVIFETLQGAVGTPSRGPKSLSEAIKRPSTTVPRRRGENSKRESIAKDRFQTLAGIKK